MLTLCSAVLALAPAAQKTPPHQQDAPPLSLNFGVYQSEKATSIYRAFTPVIDSIMASMEARLHRPVDIKLVISKDYADTIASLTRGEVDFVRVGPASYVTAKVKQDGIQLIAMETEGGDKRFKGVVIVRKDSPIKTLADLKGRKFAFGDENSTIGRYLIQAELYKAGISSSDLAGYKYLGRHDIVASAVEIGDFDAGSVMDSAFDKANAKGNLRVIKEFDNVTKPWVARKGLDKAVLEAIQSSLYAIKDPAVLKELKISGFVPTSDDEYEMVREGMQKAEKFLENARSGQ
jgi:phosphonate transport system substrate-binding protein